ncbi:MAG: hypothetical protein M1540_03805 [Candidatus Bathyarchaeota archaeon]|nr:hypothetical protein [Candidatus Bathyarchaeota archaeon]
MEATITLEYPDAKTAKAVKEAVSPDNLKTPAGLTVKTTLESNRVITRIECEGKIATFTATIDDLLFCASTAEKTLQTMNKIKR